MLAHRRRMDNWRNTLPVIFNGVADQILKDLLQLNLMNSDRRQRFEANHRAFFCNRACQICDCNLHSCGRIYVVWISFHNRCLRKRE